MSECVLKALACRGLRVGTLRLNLLTSYRIGMPRNSKNTPATCKKESPQNTFSATPPETRKYKIRIFGVFSGIFGVFFRSPVVGGIRMSGWYFWPILGFGGFSIL